jgi:hypothetical protein
MSSRLPRLRWADLKTIELDTSVVVRNSTDLTAGIAHAQCVRSPLELRTRRSQIERATQARLV